MRVSFHKYVIAFVILFAIWFLVCVPPVTSQGSWGSYNTKYEYDSIRNQEKIIRLLEDHNRSCK